MGWGAQHSGAVGVRAQLSGAGGNGAAGMGGAVGLGVVGWWGLGGAEVSPPHRAAPCPHPPTPRIPHSIPHIPPPHTPYCRPPYIPPGPPHLLPPSHPPPHSAPPPRPMASRGRARGRGALTFSTEAVGIGKGDALPPPTLQPSPLFPVSFAFLGGGGVQGGVFSPTGGVFSPTGGSSAPQVLPLSPR